MPIETGNVREKRVGRDETRSPPAGGEERRDLDHSDQVQRLVSLPTDHIAHRSHPSYNVFLWLFEANPFPSLPILQGEGGCSPHTFWERVEVVRHDRARDMISRIQIAPPTERTPKKVPPKVAQGQDSLLFQFPLFVWSKTNMDEGRGG
jgi:hypothetical protein